MGNAESSSSGNNVGSSKKKRSSRSSKRDSANVSSRVNDGVRELQANLSRFNKKLDDQNHPAAQFIDFICSPYLGSKTKNKDGSHNKDNDPTNSFYSEDVSDDDSGSEEEDEEDEEEEEFDDDDEGQEDETIVTEDERKSRKSKRDKSKSKTANGKRSSTSRNGGGRRSSGNAVDDRSSLEVTSSYDDESVVKLHHDAAATPEHRNTSSNDQDDHHAYSRHHLLQQPMASAFAKRCYFTKQGIGSHTQHYEGLTLTGNVILMLASAMNLKGCPTICDEDLRRVEQTFPNQFSRLPDELLLSSGWRRISKYCHFSFKAIPDGVSFFHSKQRLHPSGGYYFLLASAVGMIRPIDVEPLTRDTLVLLETDYPDACDKAPRQLIEDPMEWTLVDKFCFFSGGPINTEEDVYYEADFEGNAIHMLAFLSESLTPTDLYKLEQPEGFPSVASVKQVEEVYDLSEQDFEDLQVYHLGPCRALPPYIMQPSAWITILPPHFVAARDQALVRAMEYEQRLGLSHPNNAMLTDATHYRALDYDQEQQQSGSGSYHEDAAAMNGEYHPQFDNDMPQTYEELNPLDSVAPAFDQEYLSAQALLGVDHIDNTHDYMPRFDEHLSDSMQYTEDSPHYFNQPAQLHDSSPVNGSSAFARLANDSHDYDDDGDDAPIDETSATQRGSRIDPPDDEPPSLCKQRDDATFDINGIASASMSMEQSFEHEDYRHEEEELNHDHYVNNHFEDFNHEDDYANHMEEQEEHHQDDAIVYYENDSHDNHENVPVYEEDDDDAFMLNDGLQGFNGRDRSISPDKSALQRRVDLPPVSPRSEAFSASTVTVKAQQAIRNRRLANTALSPTSTTGSDNGDQLFALQSGDSESNGTWASGSDFTGESSMLTDGSSMPPDRTSRRALILQMAKARMKKETPEEKKVDGSSVADTSFFDLRNDLD